MRLSIRRRHRSNAIAALALFLTSAAFAQLGSLTPVRFVDVVEVTERDDQADISVQFNCSVRYITHLPASEGTAVRVQLQPSAECGVRPGSQIAGELPPLSGGAGIVSAVRVTGDVPGQITLLIDFKKSERFVVAQGVDPRGLRLRLIDRGRGKARVLITQQPDAVSNFAINLDSQPKPFEPQAVQLAHERLQAPTFVSETTVDGERWYRLRVGPIERRVEAERLLQRALPDYPRAWLAIADDAVTSDPNASTMAPLPAVQRIGSDPALDPTILKSTLAQARAALNAHDYTTAIRLLTKLQRQPEFPERVHVQELLGLARERAGQLAHAKAEYEEYLRRYPNGDAAERIALRLRTLRTATARAQGGTESAPADGGWRVTGGVGQLFRYDGTRIDSTAPLSNVPPGTITGPTSAQTTTQDALFNDVDVLARHHGENVDWMGRLSAGYAHSFAQQSAGDQDTVSIASVEMVDRSLGLLARLGRQIRNEDGVLGTFDGLFVSYQWQPSWAVNVAAGYPVEQLTYGVRTARRFETVGLAYVPTGKHWDASVFAATQEFDGIRDRNAVGLEARYLASRASLVALLDYDVSYHSLNTASLLGTVQLPALWSLSIDAERRNSPVLTTRNALIGQPSVTLAQLEQLFTLQEIFQLARDRTPLTSDYSMTATRPVGQRFQFAATVSAAQTGATPASGGVEAEPSTGTELTYQAQIYGSSLWSTGDFSVLTATYANTEIGKIEGVSGSARFPVGSAWRIGPRLTVDRTNVIVNGSTELMLIPSALLDYQRDRRLLQFEIGGELGKQDAALQSQSTKRYYVSLSYRIGF